MSNKIINIDIKNHTYYFFDNTIKIKIIQIILKYMKSHTKISQFKS